MSRIIYWVSALIGLAVLAAIITGINPISILKHSNSSGANPQGEHPVVLGMADPYLDSEPSKVQASQLSTMRSIGISSIRLDANWAYIQPDGPTTYDWSSLDRAIQSIRTAHMSADLIIDGSPHWAAVPRARHYVFAQPAVPAQYARFAAAVVKRYAPQGIKYFEIWNEPNNQGFWRPRPNPAAYTADLVAAYAAIRRLILRQ